MTLTCGAGRCVDGAAVSREQAASSRGPHRMQAAKNIRPAFPAAQQSMGFLLKSACKELRIIMAQVNDERWPQWPIRFA